jgi:hypothetical protein
MAITINGTGSITGLTAGGLPDGSVVASDLASSLDLTGKTVTLPSGTGGKILQVKTTIYDTFTSEACTANANNELNFNVTITPASSSNKIIIASSIMGQWNSTNNHNSMYTVNRKIGATNNYLSPSGDVSSRNRGLVAGGSLNPSDVGSSHCQYSIANYLDSPNTTSEITYIPTIRIGTNAMTWYYNQNATAGDNGNYENGVSWITVMEVAV